MTSASARAGMLRGVDRAAFVTSFVDRLRGAGLDVSFGAIERTTAAMGVTGPLTLDELYWLLRLSCVRDRDQLATFDAVFGVVFQSDRGVEPEWRGVCARIVGRRPAARPSTYAAECSGNHRWGSVDDVAVGRRRVVGRRLGRRPGRRRGDARAAAVRCCRRDRPTIRPARRRRTGTGRPTVGGCAASVATTTVEASSADPCTRWPDRPAAFIAGRTRHRGGGTDARAHPAPASPAAMSS